MASTTKETSDDSTIPIFIGGMMKSGTSLLRKLLSQHPNIFGGLETHWFLPEVTVEWKEASSLRQSWLKRFFDVTDEELANIKAVSSSGPDFFDRFMWYCTRRAGKKRWLEKTPDNILQMPTIWRWWPDAQVLHVVRDHRDLYASWKLTGKEGLVTFCQKVRAVRDAVGDLSGSTTSRYMEVSYEELVLDTAPTLQRVLAFVGEDWTPGLDQYEGDRSDYEKVLDVTGKTSPTTISLSKPIFTSSVGKWRDVLTPEEVAALAVELDHAPRERATDLDHGR